MVLLRELKKKVVGTLLDNNFNGYLRLIGDKVYYVPHEIEKYDPIPLMDGVMSFVSSGISTYSYLMYDGTVHCELYDRVREFPYLQGIGGVLENKFHLLIGQRKIYIWNAETDEIELERTFDGYVTDAGFWNQYEDRDPRYYIIYNGILEYASRKMVESYKFETPDKLIKIRPTATIYENGFVYNYTYYRVGKEPKKVFVDNVGDGKYRGVLLINGEVYTADMEKDWFGMAYYDFDNFIIDIIPVLDSTDYIICDENYRLQLVGFATPFGGWHEQEDKQEDKDKK